MDRVLVVSEEAQFTSHLEATLVQLGFEVATLSQEIGVQDAVNDFKPHVIVVKGNSARLSSVRVSLLLRELKTDDRVIIIFNKDQNVTPDELNKLKMDKLLYEPVGALHVVTSVINLLDEKKEAIRNRLLKMAETDSQFREKEDTILVKSGKTLDQELIHVTGKIKKDSLNLIKSKAGLTEDEVADLKNKLSNELLQGEQALKARIEKYNAQISLIDTDLKKGLSKRQSKEVQKKLKSEFLVDPGQDKLDALDKERRQFAIALAKKNK